MNAGDTAWVLVSAALVLLMTPGLALFYAGLVRESNVINTLKMSVVTMAVVAVQWALVGYSLVFAPGTAWIGGLDFVGLGGVGVEPSTTIAPSVPHLAFATFQMMFAIITPALISGAIVGRMKFTAYTAFVLLWSLVVYNPVAHWVWGPGGWIAELGALDFAGGTVVHVSAGVSALVAAVVLGPRLRGGEPIPESPHNVPLVVLGTSLLWFGWFGFNSGSALAADGVAATAFVTTMLAAAAASLVWIALDLFRGRKPGAIGTCIATIVGLVAITPAAGFVGPMPAMVIGGVAAVVSHAAIALVHRTRLDDTLDVFACHGVGGVVGSVLTGVFATLAVPPTGTGAVLAARVELVGIQTLSILAVGAWAAAGTWGVLWLISRFTELRTTDADTERGVDYSQHAEVAYVIEPGLEGVIRRRLSTLVESVRTGP